MEYNKAVAEFKTLISSVKPADLEQFLIGTKDIVNEMLENVTTRDNGSVILDNIREDIREGLPTESISETENILRPTIGPNSDCDPVSTVHVDAFLYDEDAIDDLCDEGLLSRNYCTNCQSKIVKPLTFITHSASVPQIKYIYQYLLPDMRQKTVLDVGSRTGAVLYGAYLFSEAERIIGVELDSSFCELQQTIVEKYKMTERIQIVHSDIMLQKDLLQASDVIILNNVFEFFMTVKQQLQIWKFLHETLRKKDTIVITIPSIQESLSSIQAPIDLSTWLKPVDDSVLKQTATLKYFKGADSCDLDDIHMYLVL